MPTTSNIIALADITQYLFSVSILQDNAFRNGSINNGRDIVIYMEKKALQYGEEQITFVPPIPPVETFYLLTSGSGHLLTSGANKFVL